MAKILYCCIFSPIFHLIHLWEMWINEQILVPFLVPINFFFFYFSCIYFLLNVCYLGKTLIKIALWLLQMPLLRNFLVALFCQNGKFGFICLIRLSIRAVYNFFLFSLNAYLYDSNLAAPTFISPCLSFSYFLMLLLLFSGTHGNFCWLYFLDWHHKKRFSWLNYDDTDNNSNKKDCN